MSPRTKTGDPYKKGPVTKRARLARVRRISRALEEALGRPTRSGKLPPAMDMLIATVLSQNTNDRNSHRAYVAMRQRYPSWQDVAAAPVRRLAATIRSGGMANQKAARIKWILRTILLEYGSYDLSALGEKSNEEIVEKLTRLKGVGKKTAACVLVFALGRDVFPVDTHVHRICGRLGLTQDSRSPEDTYDQMRPLIPPGKGYSFHTNLIRFGRKVCHAQRPACDSCPLYEECLFEGKGQVVSGARKPSRTDHSFMLLDNIAR